MNKTTEVSPIEVQDDEAGMSMPEIPEELWMLWNGNCWVVSLDDAPRGETYLVATSRKEAETAARYQAELYEMVCVPVRVKGGGA